MSKTEILIKLRNLHEDLATINNDRRLVEQVDDATIDALGQLVTDAGAILDQLKENPELADPIDEGHDLLDRVRQFESDHPSVARFLTQVTDVLAMMGI